jgi:hypothetical protein
MLVLSCGSALTRTTMPSVKRKAPIRASLRVFKRITPSREFSARASPLQYLVQTVGRLKKSDQLVGHITTPRIFDWLALDCPKASTSLSKRWTRILEFRRKQLNVSASLRVAGGWKKVGNDSSVWSVTEPKRGSRKSAAHREPGTLFYKSL